MFFPGKVMQNFVHTLNHKGNPDTLYLDPLVTYRLEIHTIPPIILNNVSVTAGKHTIIAADAPQGYLETRTMGRTHYRDMQFIIRQHGKAETLNFQKINETEKYLVGRYDIEIPTVPKIMLNDIVISQSHTTTIEIPRPGIVTFLSLNPGYGSLYEERNGKLVRIHNLDPTKKNQSYAIQPGSYTVVFRSQEFKEYFQYHIEDLQGH